MTEWIQNHDVFLWWLGISSIVMFFGTLAIVPWLIVRIPTDYFAHDTRHPLPWSDQHPLVRLVLLLAKNLLGAVFVLMGIVMLVLPGQGILTMVMGIVLLNFPGKYKLERWAATRRPVHRAIDWLRRRAGRPELRL